MEQQAIDRLARVWKMTLDGGVAERQVRIAERTGRLIAAALDEAIGPLALADADRAAVVRLGSVGPSEQAPEET
jgi:hypothetical protein